MVLGINRSTGDYRRDIMVFAKILVFLICLGIALLILKYTERLVRTIGKMYWAEKYLGPGGTYSAWKLIAVLLIFGSLIYVTTIW